MAVPPPHPDPPRPDKAALRRALRLTRERFADPAAAAALRAVLAARLPAAGAIAGYVAHRGEPDILPLLHAAIAAGRIAALPRVEGGAMRFVGWSGAPLAPGHAGIAEPPAGHGVAPAIVLAPLVGFDRAGGRLGQGGGHYDRWFAAYPAALRIGIAWSVQEAAAIPREPWDVPLHAVATEKEWIEF